MKLDNRIVVGLTAPSGTGKSYMTQAILEVWPEFQRPIIATTRLPRDGENEVHRKHLTELEFAEAVATGDIVLPHRPFGSDDTPEYGFMASSVLCDVPILTEVHSTIIQPFKHLTTGKNVVMIGMLASTQTLESNMTIRHNGVADGLDYRMASSEAESNLITTAMSDSILDLVVDYEVESRKEAEIAVIDLIHSAVKR